MSDRELLVRRKAVGLDDVVPGDVQREKRARAMVVGAADDEYEQEADRVADMVTSQMIAQRDAQDPAMSKTPRSGARVQRRVQLRADLGASAVRSRSSAADTGAFRGGDSKGRVQRKAVVGAEGGALDGDTERSLRSARNGGTAIDNVASARLSSALGADVSGVRLHSGSQSTQLNEKLQSSAFAVGNDVFFRGALPDTKSAAGMQLLAHEVTHTVQQGGAAGAPIARQLIRRKLVPKAVDAFQEAEAANAAFATGKANTDAYAAEADQEDLARVHGRMHVGKDGEDKRKVANLVRAVVLTTYSERLEALTRAKDENDQPLSDRAKARKKAVYKSKANEFREKHVPLVAKGSQAPETQMFLREHGLEKAAEMTAKGTVKQLTKGARIDVRATFIGGPVLGIGIRAHLFIVYTARDGRQFYFRGGPDENDFTYAEYGDYLPSATTDWDPSAPSVTLLEGDKAEAKLDALIEATSVIDGMKVPYRATIHKEYGGDNPNALQSGVNTLNMITSGDGENCNATAYTILKRAGIKPDKPTGKHPGWGSILGSKTKGKENAQPEKEKHGDPKPYTVDNTRDRADKNGLVTMFRDRECVEPMTKIANGTKVQMMDETDRWRRISVRGEIGYISRDSLDADLDNIPAWVDMLRKSQSLGNLKYLAKADEDDQHVMKIAEKMGIPEGDLIYAAGLAMKDDESVADDIVRLRVRALGPDRAQEVLDNPAELERIAKSMGVEPDVLVDQAELQVKAITIPQKVNAAIMKKLQDPNAANMAANEMPDYDTLSAVASELKVSFKDVWAINDSNRPKENQGKTLEKCLQDDPGSANELPNVAGYMLKAWVKEIGVPVDFQQARCKKIHDKKELLKAAAAKQVKEEQDKAKKKQEAIGLARETFGEMGRDDVEMMIKMKGGMIFPLIANSVGLTAAEVLEAAKAWVKLQPKEPKKKKKKAKDEVAPEVQKVTEELNIGAKDGDKNEGRDFKGPTLNLYWDKGDLSSLDGPCSDPKKIYVLTEGAEWTEVIENGKSHPWFVLTKEWVAFKQFHKLK